MKENKFIREEELKFPVHSLREDIGLGVEIRKRWPLISGLSFSIFLKIKGNAEVFELRLESYLPDMMLQGLKYKAEELVRSFFGNY